MALLPLVGMVTAPPIVPVNDMLRPMNRFTHRHVHVYPDNCSCPITEHSRTMASIKLSGACKRTCLIRLLACIFNNRGVIVRIEECSHPIVMKGLCAECGQDLTK